MSTCFLCAVSLLRRDSCLARTEMKGAHVRANAEGYVILGVYSGTPASRSLNIPGYQAIIFWIY